MPDLALACLGYRRRCPGERLRSRSRGGRGGDRDARLVGLRGGLLLCAASATTTATAATAASRSYSDASVEESSGHASGQGENVDGEG